MSGAGDKFPLTRPSAIGGVGSDDPAERARAFEILVRAYWRPVYAHVRIKWRRDVEEARDTTQAFFARAFEKRQFGGYDASRARFRTYLKGSVDHFVKERMRDASRMKRGGGVLALSLDFDAVENDLARSGVLADPAYADRCFDDEWMRTLFSSAVTALCRACERQSKQVYFEVFRRYVIEPETGASLAERPSYAEVADACGVSVSDVTNYLAWARREFRACIVDELRELTTSDEELREEARALGVSL